jgi:Lrp/AsnC family transcriptional regulator for asnA, asnC and gidA
MTTSVVLDEIDKQLLRSLQVNGRASYSELGDEVGLTPPAVRARIQRLRDRGVLQIVAVTDPIALGHTESAILGIRVDGDTRKVADQLGKISNVVYMVITVGGYDLMAEIVCQSRTEFGDLVQKTIREIPGVRSVDAFPYTDIHTHRFTWGVPE